MSLSLGLAPASRSWVETALRNSVRVASLNLLATRLRVGGLAVDGWYRFLAPGSQPLYGYGTLGQAFRFAGRLNRIRNITLLEQGAIGRGGTRLELEEKTEAFSLTRALANEQ
jgi:hypothetical protein